MEKENILLRVGGEGGNIKLFEHKCSYYFSTKENIFAYINSSESNEFDSFYDAFISLLETYPIFMLYPLFVHNDYKCIITEQLKKTKFSDDNESLKDWERILNIELEEEQEEPKSSFTIPEQINKVVQHGGQTVNIANVKNMKLAQFTDSEKNNTIIIEFKTRYEYIYNPNTDKYELIEINDVAEEEFPDWSSASAYFEEWKGVWQYYLENL